MRGRCDATVVFREFVEEMYQEIVEERKKRRKGEVTEGNEKQ